MSQRKMIKKALVALVVVLGSNTLPVIAQEACPAGGDASLVAETGTSVGTEQVVDGITMYISEANSAAPVADTAVLYLSDVFGINLTENRLLADSFARAGFLTVAPDLFNGQPAPSDLNDPTFNATAFLEAHGPDVTDPIVDTAINFIRTTRNVARVAVTGYCFGGRYSFRFTDPARSVRADVAFAAHPSAWTDAEAVAIGAPTAVAAADGDDLLPPALRAQLEADLASSGQTYQIDLYSGVPHGFGVRVDTSDPVQVFAKESAFIQAVRWFTNF